VDDIHGTRGERNPARYHGSIFVRRVTA
jgi:hypothetical protein